MKKITLTLLIITCLISSNRLKAQDDANCGIVIDGTLVDKIDCWTFDHMYLVFPINDKYKKYDHIELTMRLGWDMKTSSSDAMFFREFTSQGFADNFGNGQYGVWKILTDKNKDEVECASCGGPYSRPKYNRKTFYVVDERKKTEGSFVQFELLAYTIVSYEFDQRGNKVPKYGAGTFLYKSKMIPIKVVHQGFKKIPFDLNAACPVTGTKVNLKVEASGAYVEEFGVVK